MKIKIRIVFCSENMVIVFDEDGEQIPEYQGRYEEVKGNILKDAPRDTIFARGFTDTGSLITVAREEW